MKYRMYNVFRYLRLIYQKPFSSFFLIELPIMKYPSNIFFFLSCLISFLIYYSRHFDNNIIRKGNPSETHDVAAMFLKHLWCLRLSSYCLINCISSVPPSLGTIFSECFNASFVYCRSSFFTLRTSEIYLKKLLV